MLAKNPPTGEEPAGEAHALTPGAAGLRVALEVVEAAAGDAPRLAELANAAYRDAERFHVQKMIEAGAALLAARECVPHGDWNGWLEANWSQSGRMAQLAMKVAKSWQDSKAKRVSLLECTTVRAAIALVAEPKASRHAPAREPAVDADYTLTPAATGPQRATPARPAPLSPAERMVARYGPATAPAPPRREYPAPAKPLDPLTCHAPGCGRAFDNSLLLIVHWKQQPKHHSRDPHQLRELDLADPVTGHRPGPAPASSPPAVAEPEFNVTDQRRGPDPRPAPCSGCGLVVQLGEPIRVERDPETDEVSAIWHAPRCPPFTVVAAPALPARELVTDAELEAIDDEPVCCADCGSDCHPTEDCALYGPPEEAAGAAPTAREVLAADPTELGALAQVLFGAEAADFQLGGLLGSPPLGRDVVVGPEPQHTCSAEQLALVLLDRVHQHLDQELARGHFGSPQTATHQLLRTAELRVADALVVVREAVRRRADQLHPAAAGARA